MGVLAAKFEPKPNRTPSDGYSFLESSAYFEYLQKTHPELRMTVEDGVPYYVAPLKFHEPLRSGWLKTALRALAIYWPRLGAPKALFVGSPFEPYEQTTLGAKTAVLKPLTLQKLARRHGCGLVVLTNQSPQAEATAAHLKQGFRALPSFPDVELFLPGASFADYLAHQKSKTRILMLRLTPVRRSRVYGSTLGARGTEKILASFAARLPPHACAGRGQMVAAHIKILRLFGRFSRCRNRGRCF